MEYISPLTIIFAAAIGFISGMIYTGRKIKKIAYRIIFDYDYLLKYEDKKDPETLKRIMDEVFDDYDNMNQ